MIQREKGPALPTEVAAFRLVALLGVWLLGVSLSGCALTNETHRVFALAKRTTHIEPRFFEYVQSDRVAQREARLLAEQAWAEAAPTVPNASPDYENGFLEGFADYLYRGGSGEPPVIPPRGYWHLRFLNQFGKVSINDWYDGFRAGAQNCKARGIREMWVIPSSLLTSTDTSAVPATPDQLPAFETDAVTEGSTKMPRMVDYPEAPPVPEGDDTSATNELDEAEEVVPADPQPEMDIPEGYTPEEDLQSNLNLGGVADPFSDEAPATDEEIFNVPTDTDLDENLDINLDDLQVPDPNSSRAIRPAVGRSQTASRFVSEQGRVRPTGAEVALPGNSPPPTANKLRQRVLGPRPAASHQQEPMRIVVEPKPPIPNLPPRSVRLSDQDAAIEEAFNQPVPSSQQRPPATIRTPRLPVQRRPSFSQELTYDDAFPELPLQVEPYQARGTVQWDPMEGIVEPPQDLEFGDAVYQDVISDDAIRVSTQWSPEMSRAQEVPLRVAPKTKQDRLQLIAKPTSSELQSELEAALAPIVDREELSRQPKTDGHPTIQWRIRD